MDTSKKRFLVVGGPNGAGKTTLANTYLDEGDWHYLGADLIAAELCPESPESVAAAAGREFVERLKRSLAGSENVIVESTLAGRSIGRAIERASDNGFLCEIAFTFVDVPETSIARVAQRVRVGGHHVPTEDVRRRFYRSIRNFWLKCKEMADHWTLSDNRLSTMQRTALGDRQASHIIARESMQDFLAIVESDHV